MHASVYRRYLKRLLDVIVASGVLVVLAPAMLIVAVLVFLTTGRPVIFRQPRVGRGEEVFTVFKFRTMTDARGPDGQLLSDGERLTRVGRLLRMTSLDELPQLWNIVGGDMSLVGPRPLLPQYLRLYTPRQARRHEVKPGITGLAQVSGRNAISWDQKFDADLRYVERLSFWLDVTILWKTVVCVFRRDGISAASHSTMPLFTGNNQDEHRRPAKSA